MNMDEELNQCLNSIPSFVAQLEEQRYTTDLNLMEWFIMRAELFLGLLRNGDMTILKSGTSDQGLTCMSTSEPCSASLVILAAEVLGGAGLDHVMHAWNACA